jgi:hypothetical protein
VGAIAYPDIFFGALNFAGVFGVLVLFGEDLLLLVNIP